MARNANKALATATPATPATRKVPSNAHKYGAAHKQIATGNVHYALTAHGRATAAALAGKSGKPTVMALVAYCAAHCAAKGVPVNGNNITLAMRCLPAVVAAYAATKAGKYAPRGTLPPHAWCSGYIAGAARNPANLLVQVTPATATPALPAATPALPAA